MKIMNIPFSKRDKAILIGLYISKFDGDALQKLGFDGMQQALNVLGYSVGVKPASIKNYRDEFDPFFPNPRKGWHKREIRPYCKKFLEEYSSLNFDSFTNLIESFIIEDYEFTLLTSEEEKKDYSESIAKRLMTGVAAEEYFKVNYLKIDRFAGFQLTDTTKLACGFDFKLTQKHDYYCVEVKGINNLTGSISMTEKEFLVAKNLKDKYCLFIVKNFSDTPIHQYYFDPVYNEIAFKKVERQILQINYLAYL